MKFKLLGDPHLGRIFLSNVPLHRRGERENMVWQDFFKSLEIKEPVDYHVCMGDLFDKHFVSYNTIMKAALAYKDAASKNPQTKFVILKGNHDWMRDLTALSAFDVFEELVADYKNIIVVKNCHVTKDGLIFIAWHPTRDIRESLKNMKGLGIHTAFTHCDTLDLADGNINLLPSEELSKIGVKKIYNGHIHKPTQFIRDDALVIGVGSMQPYAHGEEINSDLYVTFPSLMDYIECSDVDVTNKCVRIILQSGEELTNTINCLQLTIKKIGDASETLSDIDLDDFDMESVFKAALKDAGVKETITKRLLDDYQSKKIINGT